ncbi:MAG: hypothetical protein JO264_02715 [Acidisphaera sp.]|nr:hypothetical protein [Acidisphaera sp.]
MDFDFSDDDLATLLEAADAAVRKRDRRRAEELIALIFEYLDANPEGPPGGPDGDGFATTKGRRRSSWLRPIVNFDG